MVQNSSSFKRKRRSKQTSTSKKRTKRSVLTSQSSTSADHPSTSADLPSSATSSFFPPSSSPSTSFSSSHPSTPTPIAIIPPTSPSLLSIPQPLPTDNEVRVHFTAAQLESIARAVVEAAPSTLVAASLLSFLRAPRCSQWDYAWALVLSKFDSFELLVEHFSRNGYPRCEIRNLARPYDCHPKVVELGFDDSDLDEVNVRLRRMAMPNEREMKVLLAANLVRTVQKQPEHNRVLTIDYDYWTEQAWRKGGKKGSGKGSGKGSTEGNRSRKDSRRGRVSTSHAETGSHMEENQVQRDEDRFGGIEDVLGHLAHAYAFVRMTLYINLFDVREHASFSPSRLMRNVVDVVRAAKPGGTGCSINISFIIKKQFVATQVVATGPVLGVPFKFAIPSRNFLRSGTIEYDDDVVCPI